MKITLISDTHTKHKQLDSYLPGGDVLIHAGDFMNSGYDEDDVYDFLSWFDDIKGYDKKVFIAGNHDRYFQNHPDKIKDILAEYPYLTYLQDCKFGLYDLDTDKSTNFYGSPWQPYFHNWAFNLPRNGVELEEKWAMIPPHTDILITHGPAWGYVDQVKGRPEHLGCELLTGYIDNIKPKIHICGHIHSGYGYYFDGTTHYFNASVLNESYNFENKPFNIEWNKETNEIVFI